MNLQMKSRGTASLQIPVSESKGFNGVLLRDKRAPTVLDHSRIFKIWNGTVLQSPGLFFDSLLVCSKIRGALDPRALIYKCQDIKTVSLIEGLRVLSITHEYCQYFTYDINSPAKHYNSRWAGQVCCAANDSPGRLNSHKETA